MRYFTLKELTKSSTATAKGIDNTPDDKIIKNLTDFVNYVLDPLREDWGNPIIITSGYRCPELNKAVGGSSSSVHTCGGGVDMITPSAKLSQFAKGVEEWLIENDIAFDQLITEKSKTTTGLHLGWKSKTGKQRRQIKVIYV